MKKTYFTFALGVFLYRDNMSDVFFFKDLVGGYEEKDAELHHRVCGLIWCVTLQWIMRLCLKST